MTFRTFDPVEFLNPARNESSIGSSPYYGFTYDPKVCLCARALAIDVREV